MIKDNLYVEHLESSLIPRSIMPFSEGGLGLILSDTRSQTSILKLTLRILKKVTWVPL